jgi:carbon-monoxide dehydrogenase medium subunit
MRGQKLGAGLIAQSQSALPPFVLHRPASLGEAEALVRQHPHAVIAAGCSDLMAQIREGLEPQVLISLQGIKELRAVSNDAGTLRIGSLVSHYEGSRSPEIVSTLPALAAAPWEATSLRVGIAMKCRSFCPPSRLACTFRAETLQPSRLRSSGRGSAGALVS